MESGLTTYGGDAAATLSPSQDPEPDAALFAPSRPWAELLGEAIVSEVLPRLLAEHAGAAEGWAEAPDAVDIGDFVALLIADDMEQVRAIADRVILQGGGREALLQTLLTPAARRLGDLWCADLCDFMTVTLGVYRLDQIMKETAAASERVLPACGFEHRILLLPAPGEQHSFGLAMVADAFREGGWCVRSGPAVSRAQLLYLVRDEWFDVIGLSVSAERWLKGLPACIRSVRMTSCNPDAFLMVGGHAVASHAERARFLGADATAQDAADALRQANNFMSTTVTGRLHQVKAQRSDAG